MQKSESTNEPARHPNIPKSAVWDAERGEFCECSLVEGVREGKANYYRPDGSLCCVCEYVGGKSQGPYKRFHQNGEMSQEGAMQNGERHGPCTWQRSTGETTELTVHESFSSDVWSVVTVFVEGLPYPSRYYNQSGEEILANGDALPQRPDSVDEDAVYGFDDELWFYGLGAQAFEQREGTWTWWNKRGRKQLENFYQAGTLRRQRWFRDDGSVEVESLCDTRGKKIRQRHLDANGEDITSAGEPLRERPAAVPENAEFDTEDERWIAGEGVSGTTPREGLWSWWTPSGVLAMQREYCEGEQRVERKYHDNGKLFVERCKDEAGRKTREAFFYDDGDLNHSIDRTYEGDQLETLEVQVYKRGVKARGKRAGEEMRYQFFDAKGELEAEGAVIDREATGLWKFFAKEKKNT
jgi:antitoxin component YwqK of YwqJK toxin-antitoxin module